MGQRTGREQRTEDRTETDDRGQMSVGQKDRGQRTRDNSMWAYKLLHMYVLVSWDWSRIFLDGFVVVTGLRKF